MKESTTGTDTRDERRLHDDLLQFDLEREIDRLRAEPEWAEHGRTSKTLAKSPSFRLVLTVLRSGAAIGNEEAEGPLAIQVLAGAVETGRPDRSSMLGEGQLAWLDAGPGWRLRATADAALLLAVSWPEERTGA